MGSGWRRDRPALAMALLGTFVALLVFAPWRPPLPVSDTWVHFELASQRDLAGSLALFLPNGDNWYRPLSDLAYFLTWHGLGLNAALSFPLHVAAHFVVALLIAAICLQLTRHRVAAATTGVAFLLTLPAHEVVFDYADTHRLLGGIALTGAVLAWVRGARLVGLGLVVLGLLVEEGGLLAGPLLLLYELVYRDRTLPLRQSAAATARRLAPVALVVAVYLVARLAAGGFYNEATDPCRSAECMAQATMEYTNRLVVRGDWILERLWFHRLPIFLAVVTALLFAGVALRPWRWPDRRLALFAIGWAALAAAFFAVALWGYVADRFTYVSQMGVSLAVGAVVVEIARQWPHAGRPWRAALLAVALVLVLWIGLGANSILYRGERWVAAGEYAYHLGEQVAAAVPDPAPGTSVVIRGTPQFLRPLFPPGNTGPYLFINGFPGSMRLRHGWDGVIVHSFRPLSTAPSPPSDVLIQITDGVVTVVEPPARLATRASRQNPIRAQAEPGAQRGHIHPAR